MFLLREFQDTKDYIAYVAKDNSNKRSCHVLLCKENESLDVITTIGQAFELRYNEYIQTQPINERDDNQKRFISNNTQQQSTQG